MGDRNVCRHCGGIHWSPLLDCAWAYEQASAKDAPKPVPDPRDARIVAEADAAKKDP